MDMSSLFGQSVPGLLSPEQQGNASSQGLMSLGAGLIKAGGPSETRNNFSGVGDAVQGGLDAYNKSVTTQLQQKYLAGQITKEQFGTFTQALQTRNQLAGLGLPEPKQITDILGPMPGGAAPQAPQAAPQGPGMPPAAATGAPPMPGLLSPPPPGGPGGPAPSPPGQNAFADNEKILPLSGPAPGGPPPAPNAPMAFNDRIPQNLPPGLLSPAPTFNQRFASVTQGAPIGTVGAGGGPSPMGPPPGLLSPQGAPPASPAPAAPQGPPLNGGNLGAPTPVQTQPITPAPGGQPGVNPAFANLTTQQRQLLAGGGPNATLLMKSLEPTPEMLNAKASGFNSPLEYETAKEGGKTGAAADAKLSDTIYKGITGQASIAAQQKQNIAVLRQIAESPGFTPGAGSDLALSAQRLAAQFGINPAGAAPRELFNQISARVLADQFSGLKSMASETGEAGGRIFKPMLDLEEKANITPNDSLAGVKAKLDLLDKSGDLMMKWGNMADDYKMAHPQLDPTFYKQLREEIGNARIGAVLPAASADAAPKFQPPGTWLHSPSRNAYKDPQTGKLYDMNGSPL